MAIDKLVITIDGDSSGLTKALTSAGNRLDTFNQRVTNSSRNLTRLMGNLTGFGTSIQGITAACNNIAQALGNASAQINNFANGIQKVNTVNRSAAASTVSLSASFKELILTIYSIRALIFTGKQLFGGVVSQVIDTNAQFERTNVLLQNVSGGITAAQKAAIAKRDQQYIWDVAKKAPFEVQTLTEAFVHLKAAGLDPAGGALTGLTNAVANFGGNTENLKRAQLAITQMASSGKIMMQDLKLQLAQSSGIASAEADFAEAAGFGRTKESIAKLFDAMKKGLVQSADVLPKVFDIWNKNFAGASERMMGTWDGLVARMKSTWQQTIIRITGDEGPNSLFANLKAQLLDFIAFLNTKQGDDFLKSIEGGLITAMNAFVAIAKTVYEYRDAIEAAVKIGLVFGAMTLGWRALTSVVGVISSLVNAVTAFKNITNAAQLALILFGENAVTAAKSLGILTAAGELALVPLGLYLIAAVAIGAALYGLKVAYDAHTEAMKNHSIYTAEDNKILDQTKDFYKQVQDQIMITTVKNEEEKQSWIDKTKEIIKNGQAMIAVARIDAANKAGNAVDARGQLADARNNQGIHIPGTSYNFDPLGVMGFNDSTVQKAQDHYNQTIKDGGVAIARVRTLDQQTKILDDLLKAGGPKVVPAGGEPLAGKDKLGSTDSKRSALITALNSLDALKAKNADLTTQNNDPLVKPTSAAEDAYADNAASLEAGNKATADAIKSQSQLNAAVENARALVIKYTQANRDLTKSNEEKKKDSDALTNLEHTANDQTLAAQDALHKLDDSYNSVGNAVDRYREKLENQYRVQLLSSDADTAQKARNDIDRASYEKRVELLAEEEQKAKDKTKDIVDGLGTEDQARQRAYDLEMARIDNLIAEAAKETGPEAQQALQTFYAYRAALEQKHKVDSNPFAQWAIGAQDLKKNLGTSLTGSLDGFIDDLAHGKLAFKDFAVSLVQDLTAIILKAIIAKAILSALGVGGSSVSSAGLGAGGGAVFDSTGGMIGSQFPIAMNVAPVNVGGMHQGGMVGVHRTFTRSVDPSMFAFAKKYHNGGFPGLSADEVPIIAKKGEGVFTPEQMKAMKSSGGNAGVAPAPVVNINNQTGSSVDQSNTSTSFDGEKWVVDIILKNATRPGPVRDVLKGVKNL